MERQSISTRNAVRREASYSGRPAARLNQEQAKIYRPVRRHIPFSTPLSRNFVADLRSTCDLYTDRLGFAVAFLHGDPPCYGQVYPIRHDST